MAPAGTPSTSYPKDKIKVLLLENIHPSGVRLLNDRGYEVETVSSALGEDDLIAALDGVEGLAAVGDDEHAFADASCLGPQPGERAERRQQPDVGAEPERAMARCARGARAGRGPAAIHTGIAGAAGRLRRGRRGPGRRESGGEGSSEQSLSVGKGAEL